MKSKAEMMKRLRKERKDKGLVELRNIWLKPEQREIVRKFVDGLQRVE